MNALEFWRVYGEKVVDGQTLAIQFNSKVDRTEMIADENWRANIRFCRKDWFEGDPDEYIRIGFDFKPHEKWNDAHASTNYYDYHGEPTMTAKERGWYNHHEEWAFLPTEEVPFTIL